MLTCSAVGFAGVVVVWGVETWPGVVEAPGCVVTGVLTGVGTGDIAPGLVWGVATEPGPPGAGVSGVGVGPMPVGPAAAGGGGGGGADAARSTMPAANWVAALTTSAAAVATIGGV